MRFVSARLPVLLLLRVMLDGTAAAQQPPPGSVEQPQVRRIELASPPPHVPPEISIRPGTASLLLFDVPLARDQVELAEREHFDRVAVGEDTLALLPGESLREGTRLRLTVRFADGMAPAEAEFLLVVVAGKADAQVEVVRVPPPSAHDPKDATWMEEELQRLREENARLRAARGPDSLAGAIAAPWMDKQSIAAGRSLVPLPWVTGPKLQKPEVRCFRAATRVAVEVLGTVPRNEQPWSIRHATLMNLEGRSLRVVQVWQSEPTAGSPFEVHIIVEAEAERTEALGSYTLELREADGDRTVTVGPVSFPPL